MCQLCALALRHSGLDKQNSQLLNPRPLSVLVTLNPQPKKVKQEQEVPSAE